MSYGPNSAYYNLLIQKYKYCLACLNRISLSQFDLHIGGLVNTCVLVGNELAISEIASLLSSLDHYVVCCGEEEVVSRVGFLETSTYPVSHVVFYTTTNFTEFGNIFRGVRRLRSDFPQLKFIAFRNGPGTFPTEKDFSLLAVTLLGNEQQLGAGKIAFQIHKALLNEKEGVVRRRGSILPLFASRSYLLQGVPSMAHQLEAPKCLVIGHPKYVGTLVGELRHTKSFNFTAVPLDFTQSPSGQKCGSLIGIKEEHGAPLGIVIQLSHFGEEWEEVIEFLKQEFPGTLLFAFWVSSGSNGSVPSAASIRGLGADAALVSTGPFRQVIVEFFEKKLLEASQPTLPPQGARGTPQPAPPAPIPAPATATSPPPVLNTQRQSQPTERSEHSVPEPEPAIPRFLKGFEGVPMKEGLPQVDHPLLLLALAQAAETFASVIRAGLKQQKVVPATPPEPPASCLSASPPSTSEKVPLLRFEKGHSERATRITLGPHTFEVGGRSVTFLQCLQTPEGCHRDALAEQLGGIEASTFSQMVFQLRAKMNKAKAGLADALTYNRATHTYRIDPRLIPPE